MTMDKLLDMIASNWGLEDPNTIEAFNMADRGESVATILDFKNLVDGAMADDWYGFDL